MNVLVSTLARLTLEHLGSVRSVERDVRLVFPGLTERLAEELHEELRRRVAVGPEKLPVYLALDDEMGELRPERDLGRLHYEALTSVRQGSFVVVCMPRVLPKLQDSVRGSGSPTRGICFSDEWPWRDDGLEAFRFSGRVLDEVLATWSEEAETRDWLRELLLRGLLPATAPLRDAERVPLLLESVIGSFSPDLYPELKSLVEKFLFHAGIPRLREEQTAKELVKATSDVARALEEQRRRNPEFRDYLVGDVVPSTFSQLSEAELERLREALDLTLDGVFRLGTRSRVLAFRGGLGAGSTSESVENWLALDMACLQRLLGVGQQHRIDCVAAVPEGGGLVSPNGKHVVVFDGGPLRLDVEVTPGAYEQGAYSIRCKNRQKLLGQCDWDPSQTRSRIEIPAERLGGQRSRMNLAIQLVLIDQVVDQTRIYVDACGENRPLFLVCEPKPADSALRSGPFFDVVDLLEAVGEDTAPEAVRVKCKGPVRLHVVDHSPAGLCEISLDDEPIDVEIAPRRRGTWSSSVEAVDPERFPDARANLYVEASGREREVTLAGDNVAPGEFSLEDEFRVATALSGQTASARLRRVRPFFLGEGDLALPKLGTLDKACRRRMQFARQFEGPGGFRPVFRDFLSEHDGARSKPARELAELQASLPALVRDLKPTRELKELLGAYETCRSVVLNSARDFVKEYAAPTERPLYAVAPTFRELDRERLEAEVSAYIEAYRTVLAASDDEDLPPEVRFTLSHLDSVVFQSRIKRNADVDFRFALLGPWHPLVVAKRFMVQYWIFQAAQQPSHRALASLFEGVDGFRVVLGFDSDTQRLEPAFAYPTSDPGWHVAVAEGAFQFLAGTDFESLRGLGRRLRARLGLSSPLFESGNDVWSDSFVGSYGRSHPSRQQVSLRIKRGIDARPVVDSCCRLLDSARRRALGEDLPGGVHVLLETSLQEREALGSEHVFLYENLSDTRCSEHFRPDILLLPPREERRPVWLDYDHEVGPPRGSGLGAAFFFPLTASMIDTVGLPESRLLESGSGRNGGPGESRTRDDGEAVGDQFCSVLDVIDRLVTGVRHQRPAMRQELGLPRRLDANWTVLSGSQVDAAALATYVTAEVDSDGSRALWDYRFDIGRTTTSYFIVCRIPRSVSAGLESNPLMTDGTDVASVLRDLGSVGFAVGETMRSGKAAAGVLGVVAALRLARSAWTVGESGSRRWCTVVIPVDGFVELLTTPGGDVTTRKRGDLLALNLAWNLEGRPWLDISPCSIECKYVSNEFSPSRVPEALAQAEATLNVVRDLLALGEAANGMHARLALARIVRFGLRLLAARHEVTLADEGAVLEAILSGNFSEAPALSPTLLVTTSAAASGPGSLDFDHEGLWVRLTADSWPKDALPESDELVVQLAKIFGGGARPVSAGSSEAKAAGGWQVAQEAGTSGGSELGRPNSGGDLRRHGGLQSSDRVRSEVATKVEPHKGPPEDLIHEVFHGFVGNRPAVEALSIQLRYAEAVGARGIRSVGLFGPKSTGKTELSRRLAEALGVPALFLSEAGLKDIDQLAARMQQRAREGSDPMQVVDREGGQAVLRSPPMLVFIDEVHQLSARAQDTLLPVLEADDRTLRGSRVIIDTKAVTFVIATTDWGRLREPFRSRVRKIELEPYTVDEVAQMLRFRIRESKGGREENPGLDPSVFTLSEDALLAVATAARAVPRVAIDLLSEVGMALRLGRCAPDSEGVWSHLERLVPCDRKGLMASDHEYLRVVGRRGPVGVESIAAELGTDRANVERAIEPFLIQSGWVERLPKGRSLTPSGKRLIWSVSQSD